MADNNKNPRRTIWLSETEPLSHYDIWLSKNKHLNSEGEPISNSGVLRDCDYIFKVWDCDNWHPIIGFNSTAVNKINTVYNTSYITTHDGHSINSSSYLEFHLPLFTSPNSSPLELFDAGTLGLAIFEYVTELEWLNIFEGDAFSNSFELYFENIVKEGDININTLLKPAEANKLGGIWADEFSIEDMFPDSEAHDSHSQTEINDSDDWIALAKYKLNHGTSDYNLYVNAKDIINIINQYGEDNPNAPTINIDVDIFTQLLETILKNTSSIGWRILTTNQNPSISPDIWGVDIGNAGKYLRIKPLSEWPTIPSGETAPTGGWNQSNNVMDWVDLREIIPDLVKDENIFVPRDGINISYVAPHGDDRQYIEFGLNHIADATDGAICRKTTSNDYPDIEWTPLDEIYPLLGQDSSSDIRYVVKGGGKEGTYLNWEGEWTVPTGTEYTNGSFISINQRVIDIAPYSYNGSYYLNSNNGHLSWAPAPGQQEYSVLSQNDHSTGPYVINGCNESSAAKFFLNGEGGWTEISGGSSGSTSYLSGVGINIDNDDNSININIPDGTTEGLVLSYDGNGDVEWRTILTGLTYTEGVGIDITNTNIINTEIELNSEYNATSQVTFNCVLGTSNNPVGNLLLVIDESSLTTYTLRPFSYTKINLDAGEGTGNITFNIASQKSFMKGDPVFIEFNLNGTIGLTVIGSNNNANYIDSNSVLQGNGFKSHKVLVTIQFGIVKFEAIE